MTTKRNLKRRIRHRAAKTGESYTAARRQLMSEQHRRTLRLAVAQLPLQPDPGDVRQLGESGRAVRALMRDASAAGARLVHFPEGAITSPDKAVMSGTGPQHIGPADWTRTDWTRICRELDLIAALAGELQLWVVVGAPHPSTAGARPTNCVYVISGDGRIRYRYDERMLSKTKATFMYAPGREPLVFTAHGITLGCALGMETHYGEIFTAYAGLGVDCVLFSTAGNPGTPGVFAVEAAGHAAVNSVWVGYAGPAADGHPESGLITPEGAWTARCTTHTAELAIGDIDTTVGALSREWRRTARATLSG